MLITGAVIYVNALNGTGTGLTFTTSDILRYDLAEDEYVPAGEKSDQVYGRMLKKPAAERLKLLRNAEGNQGKFVWAVLRDQMHYAAVHLKDIAHNARDVHFAMRWGYGSKQGPFELGQEGGRSGHRRQDHPRRRRRAPVDAG